MKSAIKITFVLILLCSMIACRKDSSSNSDSSSSTDITTNTSDTAFERLYILNEGNMGENRSTLDYFNFDSSVYHRNIYTTINPTDVLGLGDVGNDIQIYGSKMYAVINNSDKIVVMNPQTAKKIGQINLVNCRYVTFYGKYAYISSYHNTYGTNNSANGFVAKVDTSTLAIVDSIEVGRQPDGVGVANGKLYVANSGGYSFGNYDNTVSIIDLASFKLTKTLTVATNPNQIQVDSKGNVFVSSRGNYTTISPKLFEINSSTDNISDSFNIAVSTFYISKDTAFIIAGSSSVTYQKLVTTTGTVTSSMFITDGTQTNIEIPYALFVHPYTREIYIADAKDYQTSGTIFCYSPQGVLEWYATAGQIPGHFAILKK